MYNGLRKMCEEKKEELMRESRYDVFPFLYTFLVLPLSLVLMLGLAHLRPDTTAQESWYSQVSMWLGEAPHGLILACYEPSSKEKLSCPVYVIAKNAETKRLIVRTFDLKKRLPAADDELREVVRQVADYNGAFRVYDMAYRSVRVVLPEGKQSVLVSEVIVPYLLELADGRMIFCPDDVNSHRERIGELRLSPTHLHYLGFRLKSRMLWRLFSQLAEPVLPALLCCGGWLWIQRRRLKHSYTVYICLVLPMLGAACVPVISMYWNGCYEGGETLFSCVFFAVLNLLCSIALMVCTGVIRLLYRVHRCDVAATSA